MYLITKESFSSRNKRISYSRVQVPVGIKIQLSEAFGVTLGGQKLQSCPAS
jgi:hypothetical protein